MTGEVAFFFLVTAAVQAVTVWLVGRKERQAYASLVRVAKIVQAVQRTIRLQQETIRSHNATLASVLHRLSALEGRTPGDGGEGADWWKR